MRFLITDFKRGLTERTFFASIVIGLCCVLISLGVVARGEQAVTGMEAFLQAQSLILPFIAPLLAALPYTNMNMLEEDCGYQRLMMSKNYMKPYRLARWLVSSVVSGIAIILPVIALAFMCLYFSPYEVPTDVVNIIILNFMFGFSYGSICYGLTFVNHKRYIPTVAPQVMYLLFIYAFPYLNLEKYYPPLSFSPWLLANQVDVKSILLQFALLNILALLFMVGSVIYEEGKRLGRIG